MVVVSPRTAVVYISYDGVEEPIGQSQILPYLERLAVEVDVTLISFEKAGTSDGGTRSRLGEAGIRWLPLRYHRRPPVLSTVWDVMMGRRRLAAAVRGTGAEVVHVRSYVPALIALGMVKRRRVRLLFDIRGFWADERVEGGLWRPGGVLFRVAKAYERRFFSVADAIVTLSQASTPTIRRWLGAREVPISVIPTCVDLDRFTREAVRPGGPRALWTGSISTWYRFDLAVLLAQQLGLPFTVLTREIESARTALGGGTADARTVPPNDMPGELFSGDVGLCLINSSFSKIASMPTRFAEYLAAGMPVAVTPGVGDLEQLVEEHGVGVVIHDEDTASLRDAAARLRALAADEEAHERCRALARSHFDVSTGAAAYLALYRGLADGPAEADPPRADEWLPA